MSKKCKECRQPFEPRFSTLEKYCWKHECKFIEAMQKVEQKKKSESKEWSERKKKMDIEVNTPKYKKFLQDEINKLARMIDNYFEFKCIDCGKDYGKQQDGGHFKSVGSNASLRYNLHNIHSQKSDCNQNGLGGGRERQYFQGLIDRYGLEYAEMVDVELQQKYKYIGLKANDYPDKIKIVRNLIKTFDTYSFESADKARELLNKLIGIYN
jgi:hypothetical protein